MTSHQSFHFVREINEYFTHYPNLENSLMNYDKKYENCF